MRKVSAVIVAAGEGKRFGSPKQFVLLKGKPVLDWSIEAFAGHAEVNEIVLVLPDEKERGRFLSRYPKIREVVRGGKRRQDSVLRGVDQLDPENTSLVLVHDGVRPLVSAEVISRVTEAARRVGAAVPVIPSEDTVKEVDRGEVVKTLERRRFFRVQTPQCFAYALLRRALKQAQEEGFYGTDEAALVERASGKVAAVRGDPRNIKITTADDILIAEALLGD